MLSLLRECLSKRGETWAGLKCEGKEPAMSDKLIIDVTGVIKMSMQSFTRLVGIGSKSEDLHGARRRRWRTSSAETQFRFVRTFQVCDYSAHLFFNFSHLIRYFFPANVLMLAQPVQPPSLSVPYPRCCWTLIWMSRHWAMLHRGYWGYRSMIDWLINEQCRNWVEH